MMNKTGDVGEIQNYHDDTVPGSAGIAGFLSEEYYQQ